MTPKDLISQVQPYSLREVFRTAFPYVYDSQLVSHDLPHGINQVCISCKAGDTIVKSVDRIIDPIDLRPWDNFYSTKVFAAYKCRACGYQWSWYK